MKALRFGLKQLRGVGCGLERIAKVRQSYQPNPMLDSLVAADTESCPARVGNSTVVGGEIVFEEEVMHGTRKRNIRVTLEMDMANFRLAEAVFPCREPMRVHGNPWPG